VAKVVQAADMLIITAVELLQAATKEAQQVLTLVAVQEEHMVQQKLEALE
jgi:hypothetical protein